MNVLSAMEMGGSGSANVTYINETLSCLARNIQGSVELSFPPFLVLMSRCLLIIYYLLAGFCGTLSNGLVVYLVCRYKQLHNTDFAFALLIAVSNILGTAILVPVQFTSVILNQWMLGEPMCAFHGTITLFVPLSRTLLLLGFVINRFCTVIFTFSYPRKHAKVVPGLIISAYLVSVILSTIPVVIDCFSFSVTAWTCRITQDCNSFCAAFQPLLAAFIYIPSCVVSLILYSVLFYKGYKARKSAPVAANDLTGDQKKTNKEWRTTITFFSMFISVFVFVVPPLLLLVTANQVSVLTNSQQSLWLYILDGIAINFFISAHTTDAIFILRNKDVRELFSKMKCTRK